MGVTPRRAAFASSLSIPLNGGQICASSTCTLRRSAWLGACRPKPPHRWPNEARTAPPSMMLGGGGFLGVGYQEMIVIVAVGWFVLGPKQLLELSRDIGKIVGEVRKAANDARDTFTDALDSDIAAMEKTPDLGLPVVQGPTLEGDDSPLALDDDVPPTVDDDFFTDTAPFGADNGKVVDNGERNTFLEQLQRVSDPNQLAPSDVPDLDVNAEVEVARLEQQLQAAKKKLEEKKARTMEPPAPAQAGADKPAGEGQG